MSAGTGRAWMKVCAICLRCSYLNNNEPQADRPDYPHRTTDDDGQYIGSDRHPGQLEEKAGDQLSHGNGQHRSIQEPGRRLS